MYTDEILFLIPHLLCSFRHEFHFRLIDVCGCGGILGRIFVRYCYGMYEWGFWACKIWDCFVLFSLRIGFDVRQRFWFCKFIRIIGNTENPTQIFDYAAIMSQYVQMLCLWISSPEILGALDIFLHNIVKILHMCQSHIYITNKDIW
jgi:hypothetical protein